MNTFTVYKTSTGEILYSTTTATPMDEVGLHTDESIIEGSYQSNEYVITDGSAVKRTDNVLDIVRNLRNSLLSECDWTQASDTPLTDSKKAEWATYRQTLRDLPANNTSATSIDDVTFPTPPS
mgnify:FL=1|jgi:hypothetical protein